MLQSTRFLGAFLGVVLAGLAALAEAGSANAVAVPGLIEQFLAAVSNNGANVLSGKLSRAAVLGMAVAIDPRATLMESVARDVSTSASVTGGIVRAEDWLGRVAYVKVSALNSGTGIEAALRIKGLATTNSEGIVIDLRGAGGADIHSVTVISSLFRNEGGELFRIDDLQGGLVESSGCPLGGGIDRPAVVLIDSRTAGTAELLAACLKGSPGVVTMGEPTAGDGRVREVMTFPGEFRLNIGLRRFVPWSGIQYDGCGVIPDVIVATVPGKPAKPVMGGDSAEEALPEDADVEDEPGTKAKPIPAVAKLYAMAQGDVLIERALNALLCIKSLNLHETAK